MKKISGVDLNQHTVKGLHRAFTVCVLLLHIGQRTGLLVQYRTKRTGPVQVLYWYSIGWLMGQYWTSTYKIYRASTDFILALYWFSNGPILGQYCAKYTGPVQVLYWHCIGWLMGRYWPSNT